MHLKILTKSFIKDIQQLQKNVLLILPTFSNHFDPIYPSYLSQLVIHLSHFLHLYQYLYIFLQIICRFILDYQLLVFLLPQVTSLKELVPLLSVQSALQLLHFLHMILFQLKQMKIEDQLSLENQDLGISC